MASSAHRYVQDAARGSGTRLGGTALQGMMYVLTNEERQSDAAGMNSRHRSIIPDAEKS